MNSLSKILNQIDELSIQQQPYSDHYALKFDKNTRINYCGLFLMALLQEGAITEHQQRMLDLWLPAIGMAGRQVEFCELAARLSEDSLTEALTLIQQDEQLASALLLDIMVFARVAGPLSDNIVKLLEALAGFFQLDESKISNIVYFTAFIFGIDTKKLAQPSYNLSLEAFCVYGNFLYNHRPHKEKRLFEWVNKIGLTSTLHDVLFRELTDITELYLPENCFPLPNEIDLLENIDKLSIRIDSTHCDNNSLLYGLRTFKQVATLDVYFAISTNKIIVIPDEIYEFHNLKALNVCRYAGIKFKDPDHKFKNFIEKNGIELSISNK